MLIGAISVTDNIELYDPHNVLACLSDECFELFISELLPAFLGEAGYTRNPVLIQVLRADRMGDPLTLGFRIGSMSEFGMIVLVQFGAWGRRVHLAIAPPNDEPLHVMRDHLVEACQRTLRRCIRKFLLPGEYFSTIMSDPVDKQVLIAEANRKRPKAAFLPAPTHCPLPGFVWRTTEHITGQLRVLACALATFGVGQPFLQALLIKTLAKLNPEVKKPYTHFHFLKQKSCLVGHGSAKYTRELVLTERGEGYLKEYLKPV